MSVAAPSSSFSMESRRGSSLQTTTVPRPPVAAEMVPCQDSKAPSMNGLTVHAADSPTRLTAEHTLAGAKYNKTFPSLSLIKGVAIQTGRDLKECTLLEATLSVCLCKIGHRREGGKASPPVDNKTRSVQKYFLSKDGFAAGGVKATSYRRRRK